jgi:hypothetical protein
LILWIFFMIETILQLEGLSIFYWIGLIWFQEVLT